MQVDCESSMGGIKKVWIAPYSDSNTITEENGVITNIEDTASFVAYNFRKNTGSMTSTLNVDQANGINYVATELALQFGKMDTTKRLEIQALVLSEVFVIVKDANNKYWFLGKDEAVTASAGTGVTGTAKTDGNMYTITLTDESLEYPFTVGQTVIDKLPE